MVYFRGKNIKFPLPAMKTAAWIFHSFIHGFFMNFSFEYCLELFKEQCSGILCWEKRILSTKLALKSLLLPPSLLSLPLSTSSRLVCPFNLEKRLRKENERC